MIIFTPTVMHSGTHFLYADILRDFKTSVMGSETKEEPQNIHTHVLDEKLPRFPKYLDLPILVPMRHPARVYESWFRRKRKKIIDCDIQFGNMIDVVHPHNPMYLVIDHDERDKRLSEISDKLGVKLSTEWLMGHGIVHNTGNCDITDQMMDRVPDFVMDFYEEVK